VLAHELLRGDCVAPRYLQKVFPVAGRGLFIHEQDRVPHGADRIREVVPHVADPLALGFRYCPRKSRRTREEGAFSRRVNGARIRELDPQRGALQRHQVRDEVVDGATLERSRSSEAGCGHAEPARTAGCRMGRLIVLPRRGRAAVAPLAKLVHYSAGKIPGAGVVDRFAHADAAAARRVFPGGLAPRASESRHPDFWFLEYIDRVHRSTSMQLHRLFGARPRKPRIAASLPNVCAGVRRSADFVRVGRRTLSG